MYKSPLSWAMKANEHCYMGIISQLISVKRLSFPPFGHVCPASLRRETALRSGNHIWRSLDSSGISLARIARRNGVHISLLSGSCMVCGIWHIRVVCPPLPRLLHRHQPRPLRLYERPQSGLLAFCPLFAHPNLGLVPILLCNPHEHGGTCMNHQSHRLVIVSMYNENQVKRRGERKVTYILSVYSPCKHLERNR